MLLPTFLCLSCGAEAPHGEAYRNCKRCQQRYRQSALGR